VRRLRRQQNRLDFEYEVMFMFSAQTSFGSIGCRLGYAFVPAAAVLVLSLDFLFFDPRLAPC
jgi:hypothetical protein